MKLSVNILTLNGEFLDKAVKSVKPYAHEIIIRDTTDIQHLGRAWTNSPLDVRLTEILNEMKAESTGDWILKIDDDEIFPQVLMEEILMKVNGRPIYSIPFIHVSERYSKYREMPVIKRLFKNIPEVSWVGNYGTETLALNGKRVNSRECPILTNPFLHLGELKRNPESRKHDYSTL